MATFSADHLELSAYGAHGWIRKMTSQIQHAIAVQQGVGVGKHNYVGRAGFNQVPDDGQLSTALRESNYATATRVRGSRSGPCLGVVGRRVESQHQLNAICRIPEFGGIPDLGGDDILFVVSGDHYIHARQFTFANSSTGAADHKPQVTNGLDQRSKAERKQ